MQHLRGVRTGADQGKLQGIERRFVDGLDEVQSEMCTHAGTQHLRRPQRGRALECHHLGEAEGRGRAQHAADVAGVLQAVEHDGGHARLHLRLCLPRQHEADARRGFECAQAGKQFVLDDHNPRCVLGQLAQRPLLPRRFGNHRLRHRLPAIGAGAAEMIAFDPHLALLAIRRRIACELAQANQQRVVARADRLRVHVRPPSNEYVGRPPEGSRAGLGAARRSARIIPDPAPRAPARSCGGARYMHRAGAAPPDAQAWSSPCAPQSRTADAAGRA